MAALTSNRIYDLIERFFYPRRSPIHCVFEIEGPRYTAVRRLVEEDHSTPEKTDDAWLQRNELRSSEQVIDMLDRSGFRAQRDEMRALFVDGRCGLIRSHPIGTAAKIDPERAVAEILAEASNCHADGIILATNDVGGKIASAPHWGRLISDLYRKGEATEIFLLDHFVLTTNGWKRMFSFSPRKGS